VGTVIPKVVHRIWFGPEPMRDELVQFGESWERHGYEVQLWTEDNLPDIVNAGIYYDPNIGLNVGGGVHRLGVWVQRADLVSYELLWRFGGIYANTDMECLRSLDPILEGVEAFAGYEQEHFLSNALMGCTPGHPFFKAVIDKLPYRYHSMPGCPMNTTTGPHLLTDVANLRDDLTRFPAEFFNPFLYTEMGREWDDFPDAYTRHHWGHQKG
jgi:mannosyltransferase OCH1-like enzyme